MQIELNDDVFYKFIYFIGKRIKSILITFIILATPVTFFIISTPPKYTCTTSLFNPEPFHEIEINRSPLSIGRENDVYVPNKAISTILTGKNFLREVVDMVNKEQPNTLEYSELYNGLDFKLDIPTNVFTIDFSYSTPQLAFLVSNKILKRLEQKVLLFQSQKNRDVLKYLEQESPIDTLITQKELSSFKLKTEAVKNPFVILVEPTEPRIPSGLSPIITLTISYIFLLISAIIIVSARSFFSKSYASFKQKQAEQ